MLHAATLLLVALPQSAPPQPKAFEVHVDPRVELLTAVARLAGFDEFAMANSDSPYARRVDAHFAPFREHAAVTELRRLRAKSGVSYDAIPSFAVHVGELPGLIERVRFDVPPERLDRRWDAVDARTFLAALRELATQAKAAEFFAGERAFYAKVEERLSERLVQSKAPPWFDSFFGVKHGAKCTPIPGLLCGGGNFGVGVRFPDGRPEEITPVLGCWSFDTKGVPVFDESYLPLFIHELCHTYTNPVVDRHASELAAAGERLYATCRETMRKQAYGTWKTMLYESLVRASVVRCRFETEGKAAANEQAADEVGKGFAWVPELARLFGDYAEKRSEYPSFDAFMPKVVAFFETWSTQAAELREKQPKVVSLSPEAGAKDVDPALTQLVVVFDRPMLDQSWAIVGKPEDQPAFEGKPSYDAERKVLTVGVKLEPGRNYRLYLNSSSRRSFKSADGIALEPVVWQFSTRK